MRSTIPQVSRTVRRSSLCLLALVSALTVFANWSTQSSGIPSAAQSTTPDSGLLAGNQATTARNKISLDSYGDQNNATDQACVTSTISLNDYSVSRFDNPRSRLAGEHPYAVALAVPLANAPSIRGSTLAMSSLFGVAGAVDLNQAGDYAFLGNGQSALFLRR